MDRIACRHSSTYDWTDSHDEDNRQGQLSLRRPRRTAQSEQLFTSTSHHELRHLHECLRPRACLHTRLYSTAGIDPVPPAPSLSFSNLSMLKPPVLAHINSTLNVPDDALYAHSVKKKGANASVRSHTWLQFQALIRMKCQCSGSVHARRPLKLAPYDLHAVLATRLVTKMNSRLVHERSVDASQLSCLQFDRFVIICVTTLLRGVAMLILPSGRSIYPSGRSPDWSRISGTS